MKAMVVLSDPKDKTSATVIFRGTSTDPEWDDNAKCGYMEDTPGQLEALGFINKLSREGYRNITVS